jgi:3-deoxy-manno-octulosonate cytidylyltransferase (CMP-KDO synthetase)
MKFLAVIPARFQSTRFPGKPLTLIGGKPMLQHVYERVKQSSLFEEVIIATDDERIRKEAENWGAKVAMTSTEHPSGTDRCAEAADNFKGSGYDVVVNIQGDEPFISKEPLRLLTKIFDNKLVEIATLLQRIKNEEDIHNPNVVKAVSAKDKKVLYFSRSAIPFIRDKVSEKWLETYNFQKHIGIYAYRKEVLKEIVKLKPSSLELAESLEQLRWLENGYNIYAEETDYKMLAVDTPEDLAKAETFYRQNFVESLG